MSDALHRQRYLSIVRKTTQTLQHLAHKLTSEEARTLRDGTDGWTILEIFCHLRDFDAIFYQRAVQIRDTDYPALQAYDHEQMAIERAYNAQDLHAVLADLQASRARYIAFFESLNDDQWERAGVHPERGHFTLTDALAQVATHDSDHIEQIARVLASS